MFDPQVREKREYAAVVRSQMKGFIRRSDAIKLEIRFFMPMNKVMLKKAPLNENKPHIFVSDLDNKIKFVGDALNGVLWKDDCLIYEIHAFKRYSENPRTEIILFDNNDKTF